MIRDEDERVSASIEIPSVSCSPETANSFRPEVKVVQALSRVKKMQSMVDNHQYSYIKLNLHHTKVIHQTASKFISTKSINIKIILYTK